VKSELGSKHLLASVGVSDKGNSISSSLKGFLGARHVWFNFFPLLPSLNILHILAKKNPRQVKMGFSLKDCHPRELLPRLWFNRTSLGGTTSTV